MTYEEFKEKYSIKLNEQQAQAVQQIAGPVLLLAVPGSGKTTVLVNRLGYMICCGNILPEKILTVTYTVAATRDMKARFERSFGTKYGDRLQFRTINGLSQLILQYFGRSRGVTPFAIADKETKQIISSVFLKIRESYGTENDIKEIQTGITYAKNMMLTGQEIEKMNQEIECFSEIYHSYNAELKRMQLIDYDDQMIYALQILKKYPDILEDFQNRYEYFCVDEAQDTSKIQHEILRLLAAKSHNLFMVGDEDQSIYGFRAAYPQALTTFEQRYPSGQVLKMEMNYRSRQEITLAADRLIGKNQNRHPKHIQDTRGIGGCVREIQTRSRRGQYQYLMTIADGCAAETAVLFRNNESSLPLIDMLERQSIPYQMKMKDMTFFTHPVVRDICDMLSFALNPADSEIFMRIYYKMNAMLSKQEVTDILMGERQQETILDAMITERKLSENKKAACRRLRNHFAKMKEEPAGKAIYRILNYMGYDKYMDSRKMDARKAEILQTLGEKEETLTGFLNRLEELKEIVKSGARGNSQFVLSTIHASKGLEYQRVYMLDMIQGILPSELESVKKRTEEEQQLFEEERRLYYVAMTRAKEELYVFSFDRKDTSIFTKEVFKREKKEQISMKKPSQYELHGKDSYKKAAGSSISVEQAQEYEAGVIVLHKKFGRGAVVSRSGDNVAVNFEDGIERKLSLKFAIGKGILGIESA